MQRKTTPKHEQRISEVAATQLAKFFVELWQKHPDLGRTLLAQDVADGKTPPISP